ncbi:MAG: MerR family transcriptional regulator [Clostridiales bacterium]|nr:MerR family transcriptional regulator [Clostridiales bacterium]
MKILKKYFSISEAARTVGTTSETLRHYDRIGLVKPSKKDEWTKYRYYSKQDLIRLNTVRALQQMDLPLHKIKQVLEYDDLQKIVDYLTRAEQKADAKIAALQYSKSKIQSARADYEKKLHRTPETKGTFLHEFPNRTILLSDTLETPSLDNLWNYLSHFYDKIPSEFKEQFTFEDTAGIYTENGISRLFAVCIRYPDIPISGLKQLPGGKYLCADCTEENRKDILEKLLQTARNQYGISPEFTIQQVIISGILQWNYQIQLPLGSLT